MSTALTHAEMVSSGVIHTAGFQNDLQQVSEIWSYFMAFTPFRLLFNGFYKLFTVFIFLPMWWFYLNGPSIAGYGFWGGKSMPDICHTITKVDSHFWTSSPDKMMECENLVHREFGTFLIGVFMLAYIFIIVKVVTWVIKSVTGAAGNAYLSVFQLIGNHREEQRQIRRRSSPEYLDMNTSISSIRRTSSFSNSPIRSIRNSGPNEILKNSPTQSRRILTNSGSADLRLNSMRRSNSMRTSQILSLERPSQ